MQVGKYLSKSKTAVSNPRLVCRLLNKSTHRLVPMWDYRTRGTNFLEADWDNMILLDGCRYDIFESVNWLAGQLERQCSKASSTVGFLRTNVDGFDHSDTVYVTANGQLQNYQTEIDADFFDVLTLYADGWDSELGTVPPGVVTSRAIEAARTYPNKRLLIHYVQPHFPFIGANTELDKYRTGESNHENAFWRRVFDGDVEIDCDELWRAYRKTLGLALEHVEPLLERLDGRTIVTSDHGNMFGEHGHPIPIQEWGHPDGLYYHELVHVPWLVVEGGSRKEIIKEESRDWSLRPDPAVVEDRLRNLGYR